MLGYRFNGALYPEPQPIENGTTGGELNVASFDVLVVHPISEVRHKQNPRNREGEFLPQIVVHSRAVASNLVGNDRVRQCTANRSSLSSARERVN
jgi:hypothetical protein